MDYVYSFNMTTLKDRLESRLLLPGKNKTGLARACGVTPGAVTQWCDGSSANLRMENLVDAADYLECKIRWLATGKGREESSLSRAERALLSLTPFLSPDQQEALVMVASGFLGKRFLDEQNPLKHSA